MIGWMDLKKMIRFHAYEYCWKCQLPQDKRFQLTAHVDLSSGDKGKKRCNLEDFVIDVVWYVCHHHDWWPAAHQRFQIVDANPNATQFASWLNRVDDVDCFGMDLNLYCGSSRPVACINRSRLIFPYTLSLLTYLLILAQSINPTRTLPINK
jgi:hypothetical protein